MILALWHGLKRLLFDEAFGVKAFGYLGVMVGGVGMQILAWGWDDVKDWTRSEWLWRVGATAGLAIGASLMGQKNLSGDKLLGEIEDAQAAKKAGVSVKTYRASKAPAP